jgi:uncharacterized protein
MDSRTSDNDEAGYRYHPMRIFTLGVILSVISHRVKQVHRPGLVSQKVARRDCGICCLEQPVRGTLSLSGRTRVVDSTLSLPLEGTPQSGTDEVVIMASEGLHEPAELLDEDTIDRHRAFTSLIEELEAVDWYDQRVTATRDSSLADILAHNRDEEKEHASMTLEWLRRKDPALDRHLRTYLFTAEPVTEVEAVAEAGCNAETVGSLGIGSLKEGE